MLRSKIKEGKFINCFEDMYEVLREIYQVLRKDKFVVIIIELNSLQIKGLRFETKLIRWNIGFILDHKIVELIKGGCRM